MILQNNSKTSFCYQANFFNLCLSELDSKLIFFYKPLKNFKNISRVENDNEKFQINRILTYEG